MTIAGQFITALQQEHRIGNVSSESEQHLKHEFRKLGGDASSAVLAAAVDAEINRLERQAATLRPRWDGLFRMARAQARSEERRVGKECRSRWSPYH